MLVVVIVAGMVIGWIVGNWWMDRWINTNSKDINNSNSNTEDKN